MKFSLIVLLIAALCFYEAHAGPGGSSSGRRSKSPPKSSTSRNEPANRQKPSFSVKPFTIKSSRFQPYKAPSPSSSSRPASTLTSTSPSSSFIMKRLPSSSKSGSSNPKVSSTFGSVQESQQSPGESNLPTHLPNLHKDLQAKKPSLVSSFHSSRRNSNAPTKPTLQQLKDRTSLQSSTAGHHPLSLHPSQSLSNQPSGSGHTPAQWGPYSGYTSGNLPSNSGQSPANWGQHSGLPPLHSGYHPALPISNYHGSYLPPVSTGTTQRPSAHLIPKEKLTKLPCSDPLAPAESCFNSYLLVASWMPSAKYLKSASLPTKPIWTIHGLWPMRMNSNSGPRAKCNLNIPFDVNQLSPLQSKLAKTWISYEPAAGSQQTFWEHEWNKHGTCAARSFSTPNVQHDYFAKTWSLFDQLKVGPTLQAHGFLPNKKMALDEMNHEISDIFKREVQIAVEAPDTSGTSTVYLKEIRFCFTLNFEGMNCPTTNKILNPFSGGQEVVYAD